MLSRLFRRLFLERLTAAYQVGRLEFFADHAGLAEPARFKAYVAALRKLEWVVYAKRPFGGPGAVLAYLSRYTHRIAIANSRLVAFDGTRVTFRWKDYRAKADARYKLMTLDVDEFIRRFLIHVLPDGFHRIRHYGLFANSNRAGNIALARQLLGVPDPAPSNDDNAAGTDREDEDRNICPSCGGRMIIIETFQPGCQPQQWPLPSSVARQLMTSTLLSPSHIAAPVPGRHHTGDGYPPPTATVSTASDCQNADPSLQDHGSDPAHSNLNQRRGDYSTVVPVPNRTIRAYIDAKSP